MAKEKRLGRINKPPAEAGVAGESPAELKLLNQYVKDLSFESPFAPKLTLLESPGQTPRLQTDVDVSVTSQGENTHEVTVTIAIQARSDVALIYHVEITYGGLFRISNMSNEILENVLVGECPKLLFPSLRRVLADITYYGGYPPLMLDFGRLHGQTEVRV